jgi:hypothetical protein
MTKLTCNIIRRDTTSALLETVFPGSCFSPRLTWMNTGKSHYWVSDEFNLELINFLYFVNVYRIEMFYAKFIIINLISYAHLTTLYAFVQHSYL